MPVKIANFVYFCIRDRSLFIPQGGTEEKLKKVYIKKLPNRSGCSNFFYPTSNRNSRF